VPLKEPRFPGASKWFLMADLDDPEFLAELIRTTADALPDSEGQNKDDAATKIKIRRGKDQGRDASGLGVVGRKSGRACLERRYP
jgi:hypothetical protein